MVVGPVDVGVHQPDLGAFLRERDGQVDRDGGFADAAFAGGDGHRVLDRDVQLPANARVSGGRGRHGDVDLLDAGQTQDGLARVLLHLTFEGAGRRGQQNVETDRAVVDLEVL